MTVTRSLQVIEPTPLRAEVIHGFGRGSKVLGFPTANMRIRWDTNEPSSPLTDEESAVLSFARDINTGIYAAYACVDDGPDPGVYKVAMSVGWNPTFDDLKTKTIEPWILHDYDEDFYGCHLRLLVVAYIRPEVKFNSFDELIQEIRADGDFCSMQLDTPELSALRSHSFFAPRPALPVLDCAAIASAESAEDPAIRALHGACIESGFFVIENHGVSNQLIDRAFDAATGFFSLSDEEKAQHQATAESGYKGYTPVGGSHNCSPNSVAPERKETFYFGGQGGWTETVVDYQVEGFGDVCVEFHSEMLKVSRTLFKGLSLALGCEADFFETHAGQDPAANVLLATYPPVNSGETSCGAHTDCGFLTMLCSNGGRGLQVRSTDGTWISVASSRYKFVCNLGDLAAYWSNGVYQSTPHRVQNDSTTDRQSWIFFNNLDPNAQIKPIGAEAQELEAMTCGEYVSRKLQSMRNNFKDCPETDVKDPEWSEVVEAKAL